MKTDELWFWVHATATENKTQSATKPHQIHGKTIHNFNFYKLYHILFVLFGFGSEQKNALF